MADEFETGRGTSTVSDREGRFESRSDKPDSEHRPIKEVRASDIEPYTGLRYLSTLFRFLSVIMLLLLVAEVITGLYTQGAAAVPTLLGEASRLIVLAGVLWGTGDLAHLLIDIGHDVRASRILAARVAHATRGTGIGATRSGDRGLDRATERESERLRSDVPVSDRLIARDHPTGLGDRSSGGDEGPPIP